MDDTEVCVAPNISMKTSRESLFGFTLIELSIVLVIIGLIVGAVLVGQDLIRAASVRATVTQIEKYNTAVNTFRGKFGYLPGDINATAATQFGFAARGAGEGSGDGNGLLEGSGGSNGNIVVSGETGMFWVDLTVANGLNINLIDGSFNPYTPATMWNSNNPGNNLSGTVLNKYLPQAKIGRGNYVYVWSGGWVESLNGSPGNAINYFGIGQIISTGVGLPNANMGLTVKEAYDIDNKMDDGFPQSGRVMAMFDDSNDYYGLDTQNNCVWSSALASDGGGQATLCGLSDAATTGPVTSAGSVASSDTNSTTTCFDYSNPSAPSLPLVYSMKNNAQQVNCALSFQFQ